MSALAQLDTSFRSADRIASDGAGSLPSTRSRPDSVRVAAATRKYARREPFRIRLESLSKGSKSSMLSHMLLLLHQLRCSQWRTSSGTKCLLYCNYLTLLVAVVLTGTSATTIHTQGS